MNFSKILMFSCFGIIASGNVVGMEKFALTIQEAQRAGATVEKSGRGLGQRAVITFQDGKKANIRVGNTSEAEAILHPAGSQKEANPNSINSNNIPPANRQAENTEENQDDPSQQTPTEEEVKKAMKDVEQAATKFKTKFLPTLDLNKYGVTADDISNELDAHIINITNKMPEILALKDQTARGKAKIELASNLGPNFKKLSTSAEGAQLAWAIVNQYHTDVIVGHWSALSIILIGAVTLTTVFSLYLARHTKIVQTIWNSGKELGRGVVSYVKACGQWIASKVSRAPTKPQSKSFF